METRDIEIQPIKEILWKIDKRLHANGTKPEEKGLF